MKALDVAALTVNFCIDDGAPLTNLQLQKVLYFLDLGYLAKNKRRLIDDYEFEAWKYGPVIPTVYREYGLWGATPIIMKSETNSVFPEEDKDAILARIRVLANIPSWKLVEISHAEGSPWKDAYIDGIPNIKITTEAMERYARSFEKNRQQND